MSSSLRWFMEAANSAVSGGLLGCGGRGTEDATIWVDNGNGACRGRSPTYSAISSITPTPISIS